MSYIVLKGKNLLKDIIMLKKKEIKTLILRIMLHLSKINNLFIDNAEDLDVVMPMYNEL